MAKGKRSVKRTDVKGPQGNGVSYEHQESFDDNLLPDAAELERLHGLDPNIMDWMKETTTKEQKARHDFNSRKIGLFESSQRKSYRMDVIQATYAFVIILSGMLFSYLLIEKGELVYGSIFAGGTILFAANAFLKFRKTNSQDTDAKKPMK